MEPNAALTPSGEGGCVALNPETGTTTQGETVGEAIANRQEAAALHLSEFPIRIGRRIHRGLVAVMPRPALPGTLRDKAAPRP